MSADNEDLASAIERAPDDVQHYLVHGDWLQERGNPRGLLIALQAEIWQFGRTSERTAREDALFVEHEEQFLPVSLADFAYDTEWRCGYIRAAKFDCALRGAMAGLTRFLGHESSRFLSSLELQNLAGNEAGDVVDALMRAPGRRALRNVGLGASRGTIVSVPRAFWPALPQLQRLAGPRFDFAAGSPSLRALGFAAGPGGHSLAAFSQLRWPRLRSWLVEFDDFAGKSRVALRSALARASADAMRDLSIRNARPAALALRLLATTAKLDDLEVLRLDHVDVDVVPSDLQRRFDHLRTFSLTRSAGAP